MRARPLLLPGLEPVPREGCRVCAALGRERETARRVGNYTKVHRLNREIENHPHREVQP
ncbi:hypothetical protein [Streptomyces sp. 4F14]|uniref:hypothetical protein n=1 Tax=Streptomyces sp. 4F14 TaxID=3394380 RepID=UPI003A87954E